MSKDNRLGLMILSFPYYVSLVLFILSIIGMIVCFNNYNVFGIVIAILDIIDLLIFIGRRRIILLIAFIVGCYFWKNNIILALILGTLLESISAFIINFLFSKFVSFLVNFGK